MQSAIICPKGQQFDCSLHCSELARPVPPRYTTDHLSAAAEAPPGVFLYLGYSKKDALILQRGRVKLGKVRTKQIVASVKLKHFGYKLVFDQEQNGLHS